MTPAIEDFAAIKARLDELRREKEQQQPSPDTDTGPDAQTRSQSVTTPEAYHRTRIASEKIREAKAKEPSATKVSDGPRCGDWIN